MSGTSPTLLLVLRGLRRTDARALLKTAVKELVARDALLVRSRERRRLVRRARTELLLVEGPTSAPPSEALRTALRHVQAVRAEVHDGAPVRELTAVARHLARSGARREVLQAAVDDLTRMGLVAEETRRTLGVVRRRVLVRTPGGDALLQREDERSAGRGDWTDVAAFGLAAGEHASARTERTDEAAAVDGAVDPAFDGSLDAAFDGSFDAAFDSSFDSAFDAAFDSGFSDGGGGGDGGGDGGGGGGE